MTAREPLLDVPKAVKKVPVTTREANRHYKRERSFIDFLPWVEFLDEHQAVLLEDGRSVGAVFEVNPIGTAGRTQEHLASVRDTLEEALQDSFEEYDHSPWVIQTYTFDDTQLDAMAEQIRDYAVEEARDSRYTQAYMTLLKAHYAGITRPGGLFLDETVSQTPWGGMRRRNYMVIYRKRVSQKKTRRTVEESELDASLVNLNEVLEKFTHALKPSGASLRRVKGSEFHDWLLDFFNPTTGLFGGDRKAFLAAARTQDDGLPYGDQFTESLFYDYPRSDVENGCWWFGDSALRCVSIDGIRRRPFVGHVTGETKRGDATHALMDMLPEGSVFVSTVVVIPQDTLEGHIDDIDASAIGDNSESIQVRKDCASARDILGKRHKMYRAQHAVYLRGESIRVLDERTNAVRSRLLNYGFRAIAPRDDFTALDAVIRNLPMVYDADRDAREGWRGAQLTVVQHIANLSCLFGRSRGTGNPGVAMFNRGGEPLYFDPLNSADRKKNAHMLVLGPSGAGKSATLVSMLAHVMAVHRPRLFIIEAGNSFGLLGDWFASKGLTVTRVSLKPGSGVSLSPFQDAHLVLDERPVFDPDTEDDDSRDIMGEMEIVAQLMITGGEPREAARMTRSDRRMIRDAILSAAASTAKVGRPTLTQDVRDAFYVMAKGDEYESDTRRRLREMGDAIGLFCDGFSGELFNNAGSAWEEADVTIIDLATFAREGYEAHLAISVVSCLNMINNIAERDQFGAREIVVTIDEAHIITTNPLLAPFLVKIVKMWRKLGAWLWSATQNMEDYPDAAKKMLNMVEWWLCLVMPKEEVEAIARFRRVDEAQRDMLLSASKAPGQYTEGVVMSESMESLFRNVPPSLMLALAQTEKHEKAHRKTLMTQYGITEVEAAERVAHEIDVARGISDVS
ncbi:MAG: conjugative transfer ATPase [Halieaceae bacterium]|jgi:conjugative transfer ATPase